MYLSRLLLNPRNRAVQRDLADCQSLHRTLLAGYPDIPESNDTARAAMGVLYRLDYHPRSDVINLLVQSRVSPVWTHLPSGYLQDGREHDPNPACKRVDTVYESLQDGMFLQFRLLANPTRKLHLRNDPDRQSRHSRRVDLFREHEQVDWLYRHAGRAGFTPLDVRVSPGPFGSKLHGRRPGGSRMSFNAVVFDGRLQVEDADTFQQALESGIGPAKAYGFGLLSIAPVR
jgi:CRISPR system Cascade subunit CasE